MAFRKNDTLSKFRFGGPIRRSSKNCSEMKSRSLIAMTRVLSASSVADGSASSPVPSSDSGRKVRASAATT